MKKFNPIHSSTSSALTTAQSFNLGLRWAELGLFVALAITIAVVSVNLKRTSVAAEPSSNESIARHTVHPGD